MKIILNEIWEFIAMAPKPKTAGDGDFWIYELVAGDISIPRLKSEDILNLKKEENYDTELLPSIFTFREILWQPNVYTQPALCIPQLNILKVFCEDYVAEQRAKQNGNVWPYLLLLEGLSKYCTRALEKITGAKNAADIRIATILGNLRKEAFPLVKFFIFHPMNRSDYQIDALNRLNYSVKIMLTQYNNKYYDLLDPYWNVTVGNKDDLIEEIADEKAIAETDEKTTESPAEKSEALKPQKPSKPKNTLPEPIAVEAADNELEEL